MREGFVMAGFSYWFTKLNPLVMDWLQEDEFSRNRFRKTGIRSAA